MYGLTVMPEEINSLPSSFQFSNPCIAVDYCWSEHACQGKYAGYFDSAECCAYTKNMGSLPIDFNPVKIGKLMHIPHTPTPVVVFLSTSCDSTSCAPPPVTPPGAALSE